MYSSKPPSSHFFKFFNKNEPKMIEIKPKKFIESGDVTVQTPLAGAFGATSRSPVGSRKSFLVGIFRIYRNFNFYRNFKKNASTPSSKS
jgi:hypothetical protein